MFQPMLPPVARAWSELAEAHEKNRKVSVGQSKLVGLLWSGNG